MWLSPTQIRKPKSRLRATSSSSAALTPHEAPSFRNVEKRYIVVDEFDHPRRLSFGGSRKLSCRSEDSVEDALKNLNIWNVLFYEWHLHWRSLRRCYWEKYEHELPKLNSSWLISTIHGKNHICRLITQVGQLWLLFRAFFADDNALNMLILYSSP